MATNSRAEFFTIVGLIGATFVWQATAMRDLKTDLGQRIDRLDDRLTREIVGVQNQIVASEARLAKRMDSSCGILEVRVSRVEAFHLEPGAEDSKQPESM